jgi:murein DD-endopeptidase MepM/ murein hydrolase activator NlpD
LCYYSERIHSLFDLFLHKLNVSAMPAEEEKPKKKFLSSSLTRYFLFFFLGLILLSIGVGISLKVLQNYNTTAEDVLPEEIEKPVSPPPSPYEVITVGTHDSLNQILKRAGFNSKTSLALLAAGKESNLLKQLVPKQTLRLLIISDPKTHQKILAVLELVINPQKTVVFTNIQGKYKISLKETPLSAKIEFQTLKITTSLSAALQEAHLPSSMALKLNAALGGTFNFTRNLRPNDVVSFKYEALYDGNKLVERGSLLAVRVQAGSTIYGAVLYAERGNKPIYYNLKGQSFQPSFLRWPVARGRISSPFNMHRYHPILQITRPHTGTDFAAPYGTPIRATGRGVIIFEGQQGGYGRVVMLKHSGGYVTLYAHMSRFVKGLPKGSAVSQGQTIGYIGTSGLAEGPHVHYEVRINGQFYDPMKVKLPGAPSLPAKEMKNFKLYAHKAMVELGEPKPVTPAQ